MGPDRNRIDSEVLAEDGIYPRRWPRGPSELHAECLVEGADPHVEVVVRFAHPVERQVLDAAGKPVGELLVTDRLHSAGGEAVEREVRLDSLPDRTATVRTAGSESAELSEHGALAGTLLWRWEPLHATVEAGLERVGSELYRVRVSLANRLEWDGGPLERTLMRTLRSARLLIHSPDGGLASPIALDSAAAS